MSASPALRPMRYSPRSIPSIIHRHPLPSIPSLRQQDSARPVTHRLPTATPFTTHSLRPQPQIPVFGRSFMSSSARPAPQEPQGEDWEKLSPETKIQWINAGDRWGWVIYRCSYAKEFEGAWDDLKRRIQRGMRESIAKSDSPGIADTMEFIFVEDPALEGASVEELRSRFQAWARDENLPDYDMDNVQGSRGSRYEFFLKVDGEGLWNGYVGLAQAWTDSPEDWMKVRASAVASELYILLENPEVWYAYYTPPEMGMCNAL